jgi:putative hydrolase of the HAD superfamily
MINAVIFDFDNTLYDYDLCNKSALDLLFREISNDFNIKIDIIRETYNLINKNIKTSNNNANKFNKIIYIKQLLEELNIPLKFIENYFNIYDMEFINQFKLYDNVFDVIQYLKELKNNNSNNINIKIGILSNNIFYQQYDKIANSGLMDFIDVIQTTDECGEEKPNINAYLNIIHKLRKITGLENPYIAYIGDNYQHDISPSLKLNMLPFHFIKSLSLENVELVNKYFEFSNYATLLSFFKDYFKTVDELIFLSKYFGQSNLNVQGPGGNISVKLDDIIFIKSSGAVLGNITYNEGYCLANNKKVLKLLETKQDLLLKDTKIFGYKIPSMETFFHSFMKKYTVHIHFTLSNVFFCTNIIPKFRDFPYNYEIISYIPPGLLLSESIKEIYDKNIHSETDIYFLCNHGLIITGDDVNKIIEVYENIYKYFNGLLGNKFSNELVSFNLNRQLYVKYKTPIIVRYIEYPINILLYIKYCFPDLAIFIEDIKVIYYSDSSNEINNFFDSTDVSSITKKTNIIIINNQIYLVGETLNKVYYIIELLDKYRILCNYDYDNLANISDVKYLQNMEQEKFRKI